MVAIGLSAKSQSRRSAISLELPSPQWGEGRVRGEMLKGDSGQKQAGMTMMVNCGKLFRFVPVTRYN